MSLISSCDPNAPTEVSSDSGPDSDVDEDSVRAIQEVQRNAAATRVMSYPSRAQQ